MIRPVGTIERRPLRPDASAVSPWAFVYDVTLPGHFEQLPSAMKPLFVAGGSHKASTVSLDIATQWCRDAGVTPILDTQLALDDLNEDAA